MMGYQCSACRKPIGAFFNDKGMPLTFICPHSGRLAHCLPDRRVARTTPKPRKDVAGEDISGRAVKRKRESNAQAG